MHMVAVYVLVLHNKIRHFGKAHFLHVLVGEAREIGIAQPVIGVRIQGYVHHGLFGACRRWHPSLEILVGTPDIHRAAAVVEYLVGVKHPPFFLVDFLTVICDSPVQRTA